MGEKIDAVTLTEIIDRCLDYSMDGRFTQSQRSRFLALAKRLRGSLLNLLSARFEAGTKGLQDANESLATINKSLKNTADTLAKAAETLADLTKLVGALDKLLGVAGRFL
jgi:hypothetical protein